VNSRWIILFWLLLSIIQQFSKTIPSRAIFIQIFLGRIFISIFLSTNHRVPTYYLDLTRIDTDRQLGQNWQTIPYSLIPIFQICAEGANLYDNLATIYRQQRAGHYRGISPG
jgi:hypothetical protein